MTQAEFESWVRFYELAPFDDLHRYHRPAALTARSLGGGDAGKMIEWLIDAVPEFSDADANTLRAFGISI